MVLCPSFHSERKKYSQKTTFKFNLNWAKCRQTRFPNDKLCKCRTILKPSSRLSRAGPVTVCQLCKAVPHTSSCHFSLKTRPDSTLTHLSIHPHLGDFKKPKTQTHIRSYLSRQKTALAAMWQAIHLAKDITSPLPDTAKCAHCLHRQQQTPGAVQELCTSGPAWAPHPCPCRQHSELQMCFSQEKQNRLFLVFFLKRSKIGRCVLNRRF